MGSLISGLPTWDTSYCHGLSGLTCILLHFISLTSKFVAESVDALYGAAQPRTMPESVTHTAYHFNEIPSLAKTSNIWPAPYKSPIRSTEAKVPNYGADPLFLGGFDPFSSLPDKEGEPIPKSLLISYCKSIMLLSD